MYNLDEFVWSNEDITVLGVTIAHDNLVEKNYSTIVEKAKRILGAWTHRGLSLLGKVQVVNTLIASLFVYKMMVLPLIPDRTIKQVENAIRDFLWNGRKAKIALKILQNSKKEGGLGLVNLKVKDIALKATWPQILQKEQQYAQMVYAEMKCRCLQEDIWRCSIAPEEIKLLKITNQFWANVLESWSKFNYFNNKRIENQIIWYNSCIRINNKTFMWNDVYQRGLKFVHQLFQEQEFKSSRQVKEEFGLTELRFNSLKVAIPKEWKDYFIENPKSTYYPLPPHNFDLLSTLYSKNLSKKVYEYIGSDFSLIHNKYVKWTQELGPSLCKDIFGICQPPYSNISNHKYSKI